MFNLGLFLPMYCCYLAVAVLFVLALGVVMFYQWIMGWHNKAVNKAVNKALVLIRKEQQLQEEQWKAKQNAEQEQMRKEMVADVWSVLYQLETWFYGTSAEEITQRCGYRRLPGECVPGLVVPSVNRRFLAELLALSSALSHLEVCHSIEPDDVAFYSAWADGLETRFFLHYHEEHCATWMSVDRLYDWHRKETEGDIAQNHAFQTLHGQLELLQHLQDDGVLTNAQINQYRH